MPLSATDELPATGGSGCWGQPARHQYTRQGARDLACVKTRFCNTNSDVALHISATVR